MSAVFSYRNFILTLFFLMWHTANYAQGPAWNYTITSTQHLFHFPDDVIVCSEDTLDIGDYLGLFYDSTGTMACAGYFIWNGGNQSFYAYGDDTLTTLKEGFSLDEEVVWKTFQTNAGLEYFLDAIYAHTPFYPDSGFFINNGASELVYLGNCVSPIVSVITYDATCFGGNDGSAWIDIFPLNPPYTTTWTGGAAGDSLLGLPAGVYFVDVMNSLGFVSSRSYVIHDPDSIALSFANTPVTNPGFPNGDINLSISGGTPPFQFIWNNGATTQNLNNIFSGIYEVEVSDYYNCTNSDSTELLTIAPFPWDVIVTPNVHQVTLLSVADLFFNDDGIEIGDVVGVFFDSAGVENCAGFIFYGGSFGTSGTTIICYGDNIATPEIDGFSVGEEFKWKVWDASTAIAHEVFPNYYINTLYPDSGNFVISGQSALNALSSIEHDLGISAIISPSTYCNLGTNEDIILEIYSLGMATETMFDIKYNINGGPWLNETIVQSISFEETIQITLSTQANLVVPINYHIIAIIEANNDLNALNDTIYLDIYPIIASTQVVQDTMSSCVGEALVIANGGTPPYIYLWNDPSAQDSSSALGLCVGVYEVSITDSLGCIVNQIANVTNVLPPSFQSDVSNVSCYGFQDGYIDITMANFQFPLNYLWSTGSFSEDLFNIGPGTYILTITDGTELSSIDTFIISQPDSLDIFSIIDNVQCFGGNSGSIDAEISGGTPPYLFTWSNGATTEDIYNIPAMSYLLSVVDQNNCSLSQSYNVTQPNNLNTTIITSNASDAGICDGSIDISISGGTPPYTYQWSNGGTDEDLTQACLGYYSCTITDYYNCVFFISNLFINEPSPILAGEIHIGPNLLLDGIAILYYEYSNNKYNALEYFEVDSGKYSFNIDPYNNFIVYALPNSKYSFNYFPIYFPTYFGDELKWESSSKIHTNINIMDADIYLESYDTLFYGYGSVSGKVSFFDGNDYESNIYENNWFDTINVKSDELFAAKNIPLMLFKPSGIPVAYTLSDDVGNFKFNNIKYGDYIIHAEKAGFKTQYKVVSVSEEDPDYLDMEVFISSGNIYLGISSDLPLEDEYTIYPNPTEDKLFISLKSNTSPFFKVSIFSSTGSLIEIISVYDNWMDVSDLKAGLYFLQIEADSKIYTSKFIKMR